MSLTDVTVIDELKKLVSTIKETIEKGKRDGKFVSEQRTYFKWKVKNFSYTDSGVHNDGATGTYATKEDWFRAYWSIYDIIKKFPLYQKLENLLTANFTEFRADNLEQFVHHVIRSFLYEKITPIFDEQVITKFINELKGENFIIGAEVELDGIYLQSQSIKLGERHILRQTQITDLEIEYNLDSLESRNFYPIPSAIMRLEYLGKDPFLAGRKVTRALAIFRLFRVAGVVFYKSRMFSDSIISYGGGTASSNHNDSPLNKYLIKKEDETKLQEFWDELDDKIPDTFTGHGTVDLSFKDIAYKRYEDALLLNGTIERRIANAMMGIEAIFLTEQSELSYRLRLRVAKVMGLFNQDPFKVKNKIRDAYEIRSNFVHGGLLSHNDKEKIIEKYGSIDNLLTDILDYLRISIVVTLLMPVGKDAFLDTIDKSFLKKEFDNILGNYVQRAIQLLVSSNGN